MTKETADYPNVIRESQQEWQSWRAPGLKSFTRLHQTVELPVRLAERYQQALIDALPIHQSVKQTLQVEHPPLVMGWSLGLDDRIRLETYETKNQLTDIVPRGLNSRQTNEYMNGMAWIDEVITGQAAAEAMDNLRKRPFVTSAGALSRIFLDPELGLTHPDNIPKRLSKLTALLEDSNIRIHLLSAWFAGDKRYANSIFHKEISMSLDEFTLKMGKSHSYNAYSKNVQKTYSNSAEYLPGRGIADIQEKSAWFIPLMTALPIAVTEIALRSDIKFGALLALYDIMCIAGFMQFFRQSPSSLAHETMHYLAEGTNHTGWYKIAYSRES